MSDLSILKKLEQVAGSYPVKKKIMTQMVMDMTPYVPVKSGKLRKNVKVTPNGIVYKQVYAHYQYYGHFKHVDKDGRSIVPTRKWDQTAKQFYMDKWRDTGVKAILKEVKG